MTGCGKRMTYDGYTFHTCGKPVKEDGLCGLHLAAKRRVLKNVAEADKAREEADRVRGRVQAACAELAKHGIDADPHIDTSGRRAVITGKVVVDPDVLLTDLRGKS